MIKISVIIPTLNETGNIADLSIYLNDIDNLLECIVSDGGSSDDTVAQAKSLSTVVDSAKGRGAQMNAGAAVANGDILWFIHADCRPHKEAVASLRTALTNVAVVGGAFEYNLKHPSKYFRLTEYLSN